LVREGPPVRGIELQVLDLADLPVGVRVDELDPAFAPGTGTPEPGGMSTVDLLWACREIAASTELAGFEIVEVIPTLVASADITALAADRIVREVVTGLALARRGQG
jgi:agmatinase